MKDTVKKLLVKIKNGARPDLKSVKIWLDNEQLSREEYEEALADIETHYNLTPDAFDSAVEAPGKDLGYTDDFMPLMYGISGFLKEYVEHTKGQEAPTAFHFATAMTLLGASLKRRTWVDQSAYKIYPAVQTMLVGPSGKVKKSTSAKYGVDLTWQEKQGMKPLYNRLMNAGTGEALIQEIGSLSKKGDATGLLFVSELGVFLGKQEYNVGLVQILTDLFDCPDKLVRKTKTGGKDTLENVGISSLLCSNEEWLADAIPSSAFGGGFFGRMLVYYQSSTDRSFARPCKVLPEDREALLGLLEPVRFIAGETELTPEADKLFEVIYNEHKKNWPEEERVIPFYERIPDHLLRIAMLLSISEDPTRNPPRVAERHIHKAKEVLDWIFKYLPRVYAHLGGSKFGSDHYRIYEIIRRTGGTIEEKELGRRMARRLSKKQLQEHLETMQANGVVQRVNADPWEGKYSWRLLRKMS